MKNKATVRILALALFAALLLSLSACAAANETSAPAGMKLATAKGADFRLYIPTSWNTNTAYGISGGYYSLSSQSDDLSDQSTVTMVKYDIDTELAAALPETNEQGERCNYFFDHKLRPLLDVHAKGGVKLLDGHKTATLLGEKNAWQYHYSTTVTNVTLKFWQVIAEGEGCFYVFTFTATEELYTMLMEDVANIAVNVKYGIPYEPNEPAKPIDPNASAPEGMKLASNDEVAYRFYVPTEWGINTAERIFSAYSPDGKGVVSVIPYVPNGSLSAVEYFEKMEAQMKSTAGENGYSVTKEAVNDFDFAGGKAFKQEYTWRVGDVTYYYLHLIIAYKSTFYNFTYAANSQKAYNDNMEDVMAMIDAFTFR